MILCFPNVTNISYHDIVSYQFSLDQKGVLVSVVWEDVVSDLGSAMAYNGGIPLQFVLGFTIF